MLFATRCILLAIAAALASSCTCGSSNGRPALTANPAKLDFGTTAPGAQIPLQVVVTNQSLSKVNVTGASIDTASQPFTISPAGAATLGPNESITYTVTYAPTQSAANAANAVVSTNLATDPHLEIPLTGTADSSICVSNLCTHPPTACYEATGSCADAGCSYPVAPAGTACDDGNACTVRDTCSASGICAGTPVACNTPPAPSCLGATVQRTFTFPGVCNAKGTCVYPEQDTTCATTCDSATGRCTGCTPTTCAAQGIACGPLSDSCGTTLNCGTCQAPPPPTCVTGTTSRTFTAPGTCTTGACAWGTVDTPCSGACNTSTGLCATCVPTTCAALGKNCGSIPDNCGGMLSCGNCVSPQVCSANVCANPGSCTTTCASWVDCTQPGTGCDSASGCCVACGGDGQPCCVDFTQGLFFCGAANEVCGISEGNGTGETYYCCANQGDGCCQQGGCGVVGNCCSCPQNGLNFCVDPAFGCGGC